MELSDRVMVSKGLKVNVFQGTYPTRLWRVKG